MRKNLALLATLSMLVIGLSPLADQPEAKATTTVTHGNCSIEVNNTDGVTIVESGNECVAEFKTTGINYNVTLPGTYDIKYLLVGGGGAGGDGDADYPGSGGGGGQVVEGTATTGSLTISVGAGGVDADGHNSSLDHGTSVTALGGKFPGDSNTSSGSDLPQGGDSGSGKSGGNGTASDFTNSSTIGAGGGGDSTIGKGYGNGSSNFTSLDNGKGGLGTDATLLTTTSITSFGGGGSGGVIKVSGDTEAINARLAEDGGGTGGGNYDSDNNTVKTAENGDPNTGGGGGGGGKNSSGGNGGSGFAAFSFTLPTLVDVGDNCTLVGSPTDVTVNKDGDDCIVEFKSTDVDYEFKVPSNITEAWVLAVGGGGGGGCLGGGGAGGYIEFYQNNKWTFPFPETSDRKLSIRVGDGGLGAARSSSNANNKTEAEMRGESTFIGDDLTEYYETTEDLATYTNAVSIPNDQSHIQAIGGGGGACLENNAEQGSKGASSGGSGASDGREDLETPVEASVYDHDGDTRTLGNITETLSQFNIGDAVGSGGGGASSKGSAGGDDGGKLVGGNGGEGRFTDISGSSIEYAGGGGGGANAASTTNSTLVHGGQGGLIEGGDGAYYSKHSSQTTSGNSSQGADGTGGGGGGGAFAMAPGEDGGSGIAIIRFTIPPTPLTIDDQCSDSDELPNGVSTSDDPANCVVKFTTPGITYDVTLPSSVTFDYLLVGGGGAGGSGGKESISGIAGGGGGGGEVLENSTSVASASFRIRVGDGGDSVLKSEGEDGKPTTLSGTGLDLTARPGKGGLANIAYGSGGASGSGNAGGEGYSVPPGTSGRDGYIAAGGGGQSSTGNNTLYSDGSGGGRNTV